MDDLTTLEEQLGALVSQLEPAARRKVAVDVGRELRRSQQKRIKEQTNPDGTAYAPRKPRQFMRNARLREKAGRIKRRAAMFAKLRTARFLKVQTDSSGVAVGFVGRAARLANVHQGGESSEVANGRSYKYPVRQLLGFTEADREMVRDKLLEHLAR